VNDPGVTFYVTRSIVIQWPWRFSWLFLRVFDYSGTRTWWIDVNQDNP